jgi:hypothetical protein
VQLAAMLQSFWLLLLLPDPELLELPDSSSSASSSASSFSPSSLLSFKPHVDLQVCTLRVPHPPHSQAITALAQMSQS